MRALRLPLLLATLVASPALRADTAHEAREAGSAARASISVLSEAPAREGTPGYSSAPGQTALGGSQEQRDQAAADQAAECAGASSETPACEALTSVRADAAVRQAAASMDTDPEVIAARNLGTAPLANPSLGYSACEPQSREVGSVVSDIQSCHDYYLRVLDQSCTKVRHITVNWSCNAGAQGTFIDSNGDYYCKREVIHTNARCGEGEVLLGAGQGAVCRAASGAQRDADIVLESEVRDEPAVPEVIDTWLNPCADRESRVPPGLLRADGDNTHPAGGAPTGRLDKCERVQSQCSDAFPQARFINRLWVSRPCWAYTNTFNCVNHDPRSDCNQPRYGACSPAGERCEDFDAFDSSICTLWTKRFSCVTRDTRRTETVTSCANQTYTDNNGTVWATGHPPNNDFQQVVSFMEIARQAGKYNENGDQLFRGFDNRCRKKLFGLVNCCNRSGGPAAAFNNLSLALQAGAAIDSVSPYVFDGLFGADSPSFVERGFAAIAGGDFSALAGLFGGNFSVQNVVSTLAPSYWTIAVTAIAASGLLSCDAREQELTMKRDARLCEARGAYCSRRLAIIRTCIERTETYCCFNSILAKLINRQGKAQLGQSLGNAREPNCGGFTALELQQLNLATMDFSEFYDSIHPVAVRSEETAARANPDACYYGEGQCGESPR